jgi:hypothetical protein
MSMTEITKHEGTQECETRGAYPYQVFRNQGGIVENLFKPYLCVVNHTLSDEHVCCSENYVCHFKKPIVVSRAMNAIVLFLSFLDISFKILVRNPKIISTTIRY